MRVLLVHNHYQQPGGEDQVFAAEGALLEAHGHAVTRHTVHNDEVAAYSRAALATNTVWSQSTYAKLRACIRRERPQVVHVHNTFPLLSPSVYYAAHAERVAVVQTLHNYRLLCLNALLMRDGRVCEDCVGRVPTPGVVHRCYHASRAASGAVAALLTTHRVLGTWTKQVDVYIALTEFARRKFIQGGLPAERIRIKSNFVSPDPGLGKHRRGYALFVGRLSAEKGLDILLDAWDSLGGNPPLKVVGEGPLRELAGRQIAGVEWLGQQSRARVLELMSDASLLVFPSRSYEAFGLTIAEAFSTGLPVLASRLGAPGEIVRHGINGLHFTPGDALDLANGVRWAFHNPGAMEDMGVNARADFVARYSAEVNYRALLDIYREAMQTGAARWQDSRN